MIRKAVSTDLETLACLAAELWPRHSVQELQEEFAPLLARPDACFFLLYHQGEPAGFAQCQLRHDYVQGTRSSPVGYLEGIFVREDCRRQGYACARSCWPPARPGPPLRAAGNLPATANLPTRKATAFTWPRASGRQGESFAS